MSRFAAPHTLMALAVACVLAPACAQIPAITADVVQEVQCVENEIAKGDDTFEDIALACAPLAVSDVVTIVTALASSAPDAAASSQLSLSAKSVHHKAAAK
jgi:hypothetical protein